MNILDYKKNPIYRILETIKMEALRYNVKIHSSEVIGLCPSEAIFLWRYYFGLKNVKIDINDDINELVKYANEYLLFRDFDKTKIIEHHIEGIL